MAVEKNDHRNFIDKTISHDTLGIGKVKSKTGDMIFVEFDSGEKRTVHTSSVTVMSNSKASADQKEEDKYAAFLAHAPQDIKNMFNAFSDEDKKKYAEIAEFTPEHRSFSFTVKMSNGLTQHAFWKFSNKKDIPDEQLQPGKIEKHTEAVYGVDYFASKEARKDLIAENLGLTPARFQAFVKSMPAGDYKNLGSSSAAHLQAFISLGGKFSGRVQQTIVDGKPQYKKLPATMDNLLLHRDDSNVDRTLVCGYLALAGTDKNGKSRVLSAVKDKDEKPGYDHYTMDNGYAIEDTKHPDHGIALENDLLPSVSLIEPPIIRYTNDAGQSVDKEGKPL